MKSFIENFGAQIREGIEIAENAKVVPSRKNKFNSIVLIGLGGSAFGGEIVKNYISSLCRIPFAICREYELPKYVGKKTLVLACSYSGNTEETLSAFEQADKSEAEIVCITSGGKLAELAKERGKNCIIIPSGYPPRAAVGFAIVQQLRVLHKYGYIPNYMPDLNSVLNIIDNFDDHELARKIAKGMRGKMLFIYSSIHFESIAIRWRQQIEENSKQMVSHHIVPEMNHNELVGWAHPASILTKSHVTFIESKYDHPRVTARMRFNKQTVKTTGAKVITVKPGGRGYLPQLFYFLHLGDWVSYYLAEENGENPMPVKVIDNLKNALAKITEY